MGLAAAVERKDVVLAVLGASAGLAGLILVFLGLVVTTLQSYSADTPPVVLAGYKRLALLTASAFAVGIAALALCAWWLAGSQPPSLYWGSLAAFAVQLGLLVVSAVWVLLIFVWKNA